VILAAFLATTTVAWVVAGAAVGLQSIVTAAQVAAWQLKWVSAPLAIVVIWGGLRSLRSIKQSPAQFGGLRIARTGVGAAIVATLMVGTLIGVTVPERLRRRQWRIEAAEKAQAYTFARTMLEYRALHGTLPPQEDLIKHLRSLPDPDGSIAEALSYVDQNSYEPTTVLAAAAPKSKTLPRGAALRNASLTTPADPPAVSFTNYQLRLPGADKKLNTDDDIIVRDGLVMTVFEFRDFQTSRSNAR
jgi:hypothetical protein